MAAYSGQTFPVVWGYKTYPGTITLQTAVSITNFKINTTQATTNYRTYLDGIRFREGNTDGSGYFVIGTSTTTYAAGTYYTFQSVATAWYVIQNDSAAGFTFQVTAWHTIQNDSKSIYFEPYDFHTIQADSIEYRIGTLITAQEFNGTLQSSGTAPIVEPGTDTETNIMGIIWLLVFFLPAILLFAYLGKLGGTVGMVLMSVVSAMAFDMGIFIMIIGIISAVVIMLEADGGD
jgi:predicted secreted protein